MEILAIISGAVGIVLLLLREWISTKAQREEQQKYAETQNKRANIATGNLDAVNQRIDRVLSSTSNDTGRQHSADDLAGRVSGCTGAQILPGARNAGTVTGEGGGV